MADYSTEDDLSRVRRNVLEKLAGTGKHFDVTDYQTEAATILDRDLVAKWYKSEAYNQDADYTETEFDRDLLLNISELKRVHVYKVFELIFESVRPVSDEISGYERERRHFAERYRKELKDVLDHGISYDWGNDGSLASDEKYLTREPRLVRV